MTLHSDTTAPDLGAGPYGVDHDEADGFFYLTLHGTRTGKSYPLGKTAYRTARRANEDHVAAGKTYAAPPEPKVTVSKSNPPNPKGSKASKSNPPTDEQKPKKAQPKAAKPKPQPEPTPAAKAGEPGHSAVTFQGTREEWLMAFVAAARPVFAEKGHALPDTVRVSVGFPYGARGGKAIGQCWSEKASADNVHEIFVIPTLDDSARIAGVLTHELCHAAVGIEAKHGPLFKQAAQAMGLEGKMTATTEGDAWREWALPILEKMGGIPHAKLDPGSSGIKKQSTRLLKAECGSCGLVFRITAKWVSGKELICPDVECGGPVCVEVPEDGGE